MKTLLKIALFSSMFIAFGASAQQSVIGEINYNDLENYISLAKKNFPRKKMFEERVKLSKVGVTTSQLSYLDIFNASYYYRPSDRRVIDPINPYNVNGVQFGVNISLGSFLSKPFDVKRSKGEYKISQLEDEEYNTTLTMEVKRRYYDYILMLKQLKINTQSAQDNKSVTESLKNKFEKGEITLDAYNQSRIAQSGTDLSQIQAEVNYLKAKDLLEEMIGVKLSDVKK
ncbi:outer membrane protein TolC [Pedobacter sp. AK017]|uniref:TolC family protein n=1 Tax=Pedobacter sp. AK017 TaxID=2723073 RepID=UPI00161CC842|nr:TolC family protein [Pedobacter sp. AK017]MBB5436386.1 outer membrane protein TolC [Pedobacter sp. AK017]